MTRLALPVVGLAVIAGPLAAQSDSAAPPFEVASVKRNISGSLQRRLMTLPGGRFTAVNITTLQLIEWAYQLPPSRIAGATGWVASEHFDVEARAGGEVPPPRLRQMVRRLLADRFGLIVRNEQREVPAFTLVPNRSDSRPGPAYRCKLPLQNSLACACNAGGVRWMCWSSTASRVRRSTD